MQPWIRSVALADMWTGSCQQDVAKPRRFAVRSYLSSTLELSLIGRQLIPYHCSMILFVTTGIRDITGVDISSPANNTTVYLCQ